MQCILPKFLRKFLTSINCKNDAVPTADVINVILVAD